jgi:hypothetical protein
MPKRERPEPQRRTAVVQQLNVSLTDEDVIALMRQAKQCREQGVPLLTCCIDGFNEDPRDLGDIPEVREFCKRLVRLGYISFLDVATSIRELGNAFNGGITLGAWEVWRMARDALRVGPNEVDINEVLRFLEKDIKYLNTVADDHLSRR